MENKEETGSVFISLKPIGYLMKSFGLFPLSLKKSKLSSRPVDILTTIVCLGVYTFLVAANQNNTNLFIENSTSSIALTRIWKVSYYMTMLSQVCMLVHQWWKIKEITQLINQIHNVDEAVRFY